jgi:hypothetical protein
MSVQLGNVPLKVTETVSHAEIRKGQYFRSKRWQLYWLENHVASLSKFHGSHIEFKTFKFSTLLPR